MRAARKDDRKKEPKNASTNAFNIARKSAGNNACKSERNKRVQITHARTYGRIRGPKNDSNNACKNTRNKARKHVRTNEYTNEYTNECKYESKNAFNNARKNATNNARKTN